MKDKSSPAVIALALIALLGAGSYTAEAKSVFTQEKLTAGKEGAGARLYSNGIRQHRLEGEFESGAQVDIEIGQDRLGVGGSLPGGKRGRFGGTIRGKRGRFGETIPEIEGYYEGQF